MAVEKGVIQLGPDAKATVQDGVVVVAPREVEVSIMRKDDRAAVVLIDRGQTLRTTVTALGRNGEELGSADLGDVGEGFLSKLPAVPKGGSLRMDQQHPGGHHWQGAGY